MTMRGRRRQAPPEARPRRRSATPPDSRCPTSFAAPEILVVAARLFGVSRRDRITIERHIRLLRRTAQKLVGDPVAQLGQRRSDFDLHEVPVRCDGMALEL